MPVLKDEVKQHIVQALACFDTPSQIVESVKENYGIVITRQQAAAYDPTKLSGKDSAKKWKKIFEATREAFLKDVSTIPIAQPAYRLRVMQRMLAKTEKQGNVAVAAQLLEQAAKDTGGVYTNRQKLEHTGANGNPLPPAAPVFNVFVKEK